MPLPRAALPMKLASECYVIMQLADRLAAAEKHDEKIQRDIGHAHMEGVREVLAPSLHLLLDKRYS